MDYTGTIIEESLSDKSVLEGLNIVETKVEPITPEHKTPWLKQWTLHKITVDENEGASVADKLSRAIDQEHSHAWYADFKNDKWHYIIFKDKVFHVNRAEQEEYEQVKAYGVALGVPEYQLDFSPDIR